MTVEHLVRDEGVAGSNPVTATRIHPKNQILPMAASSHLSATGTGAGTSRRVRDDESSLADPCGQSGRARSAAPPQQKRQNDNPSTHGGRRKGKTRVALLLWCREEFAV